MKESINKTILGFALLTLGAAPTLRGDTNSCLGCRVGDTVVVKASKPLVLLRGAHLVSITVSNVVVQGATDKFTISRDCLDYLAKDDRPPKEQLHISITASTNVPAGTQKQGAAATRQDMQTLMDQVEKQVLCPYANDPNYDQAVTWYRRTMRDYLDGRLSPADIKQKGQQILERVNEYRAERAQNPQFESLIQRLQDLLQRN